MEFRILGPLEVLDEGGALELGGSRQRQLLAILLVQANQVVSADRLIDQLWGEEPPATAAKSLQVYVSRLRKTLGRDDVLLTRGGGYVLAVDPGAVDAARFEGLAANGRAGLAEGDVEGAVAELSDALRLWRGPALAEFAYEAFAVPEIARLEELRLTCIEERVEADLALGRHSELTAELEGLVAAHPLRERLRLQLMLALYRSGRQAEALEAYQHARRVLRDELGIEPGRPLRELERAILQQDPTLDRHAAPDRSEVGERRGRGDAHFVGRAAELEELFGGITDALAGRSRLFLLVGEAGIGKSRLAEETAAHAEADGARVLWGRCWEAGGAPAYWPWVQALRSYVAGCDPGELSDHLRGNAALVGQLVPELGDLLPELGRPQLLDGEGARFQLFDATATFLARVTTRQPLVLVLDDLHAADEPSLLLLRFVATNAPEARLLIIGAYREDEVQADGAQSERLSELARCGQLLSLAGLGTEELASFVELVSGSRPTEALVAALYEQSDGNPLFAAELVRLGARNDGDLAAWDLGRAVVPRGIRDVIGRRLRKLSPDCRRLLEAGAIFGREFRLETLSRPLAIERAAVLDAVDEAASARIVTKLPGAPTSLRFVHELIRETVYDGLGGAERAMLHRCAGEALAELYSEDEPHLAELARHFLAGDEPVRALEYARRAADQALKLLAYEEAARLYRSALEALAAGESPSSEARCELLLALGEAQARAGAMPQARESFLAAAELARSSGAGELLARAALGYGGRFVWLRAGTDRRIVPLLEDALALLPGEDSILRARVMARLAGALRDLPSAEKRVALCREAVAIARRLGDPATLAYTLDGLSALAAPDVRAWFELAGEMVEITHAADDRERMFNGRVSRAGAAMSLGDIATANADVETMALLAAELRQPAQLWMTTVFRAMRALFEGRLDEAERLIPEARSIGQTAEAWDSETVYQIQLFSLRREQARLDEVDELVQRTAGDLPARPLFRCMAAAVHVALGRSDKGRETIDALAERDFAGIPLETEWGTSMSLLAEACASLGDTLRSGTLYELLLPHADTNVFNHPEVSRGATARYLGLLAASSGRWADAAGHFEHALEQNARMGARPWLAWTQHDYARALIASGEAGERSTQLSAAAAATAQELGLTCLASQIAAQE